MVGTPGSTLPLVQLSPNGGGASEFETAATLQFDVQRTVGTSYVDIEQRSPVAQDLVIAGPINNPLGLTRLVNLNGSITFTVVGTGAVTTNQLDVYAPERFGGQPQRTTAGRPGPIRVDRIDHLVHPPGRSSTRGWWSTRFGDVYLSLRGVDRADPTATSMTLYVDSIAAGGQAMLTVRTAVAQQVSSGSGSVDVAGGQREFAVEGPDPALLPLPRRPTRPPSTTPAPTPNTTPDPSRPIDTGTPIATTVIDRAAQRRAGSGAGSRCR